MNWRVVVAWVLSAGALAGAAIVDVPWNPSTKTYSVSWSGWYQVNSGNYDPVEVGGTYQKDGGVQWIATTYGSGGNYGTWEYRFTGGPGGNLVGSVTVDLQVYQNAGAYNYSYAHFGTAADAIDQRIYVLWANTSFDGTESATFGSAENPLGTGTVYVKHTILNGWYATSIELMGMTITATPLVVTVTGSVALESFRGDMSDVMAAVSLQSLSGGDNISQTVTLNGSGEFSLGRAEPGDYMLTVQVPGWLTASQSVTVPATGVLDPITLKCGDVNGDDMVTFEDFSGLQNNYGDSGAAANPLAAAAASGCGLPGMAIVSILALAFLGLAWREE